MGVVLAVVVVLGAFALTATRWWWTPGVATALGALAVWVLFPVAPAPSHGGMDGLDAGVRALLTLGLVIAAVLLLAFSAWGHHMRTRRPPPATPARVGNPYAWWRKRN